MKKLTHSELETIWATVPPDYYFKLNFLQKIWHEWKWITIKHLSTKYMTAPKTILEVGCAGGHLSGMLQKLYPKAKITGIDVYKEAVEYGAKVYPKITFKVADAHKLPFRPHSFDLVICSETIEHVVDPTKVLSEIKRVLTPTGYALVEMDSGSPLFRLVWFLWTTLSKGKVWKDAHLHPFTWKELEAEIKKVGFHINEKLFSHFGMAISFLVSAK